MLAWKTYLLSILWLFCVSICIYLKIQGMVKEYLLLSIYSSCLHFYRMFAVFLGDGLLKKGDIDIVGAQVFS